MLARLVSTAKRLLKQWGSPRYVRYEGPCDVAMNVKFLRGSGEIVVGRNARILRNSELLGPLRIGPDSFINRDGYIRPGTTIGANVALGPFCRLVTDSHEIGPPDRRVGRAMFKPIVIGDGAWLGASVTVLGGVTIGRGSVVAAGSLVVKDVPSNTLVAGVPAKEVRRLSAGPEDARVGNYMGF